ncbi:MAG: DUF4293 domain-containing protein [Bacteroides sp.]|nr:DUF4293 domain-containing protein [Bacteroides sp.]
MVIQRLQSLLLLVAAAVMGCFTFCSIAQIQTTDFTFNFTSLGFYQEGIPTDGVTDSVIHTWYFFALSLTTTLLLLIDIFLFKNLPLQKKVCIVAIMLTVASVVTCGCLAYNMAGNGFITWSPLVCAPFLAIIASIMAWNCMQRDYNTLKAVDRIR